MHRRNTLLRRWRRRLRGASGAVDLASIMVGVIVIGLLAGVLSASVFGVIPWAQDHAAQQNLDGVRTAESVHRATSSEDGGGGRYADYAALAAEGTLPVSDTVNAAASAAGDCYAAVALSGTGNMYWNSSEQPQPRLYDSGDPDVASVCGGQIDLGALAPGAPSNGGDGDGDDGDGTGGDGGDGGGSTQPACVNWQGVFAGDTGGRVAAVTNTDARLGSTIQVSGDGGVTWAAHPELGKTDWTNVSVSGNGEKLVAAQYADAINSQSQIWVSVDGGASWAARAPGAESWSRVAYSADGTTLVALAYGAVYVSHDDGANWTVAHPGGANMDFSYIAVTGNGSRIAITTTAAQLYIWDGTQWVNENALGVRMWGPIDYSNDGSLLAGRVDGQQITDVGTWAQDDVSPVTDQYNPDLSNVLNVGLSGDGHHIIATGTSFSPSTFRGTANGADPINWVAGPTADDLTGEWRVPALSGDGSSVYVPAQLWSSNHWNIMKSTDGGATFTNLTAQPPCKQLTPGQAS